MSIQIKNLQHIYNEGTPFESIALKDINIDIKHNEFIAIIGSTGSGKSTLIQHLNGLLKPTSEASEILIYGEPIFKDKSTLRDVRRKVGLIFQYPEHQLFETSVFNDVAFGPKNIGLSSEEVEKNVIKALKIVNLPETLYHKSPFELSGGQKRKVAIAGVLSMEPKVLILDEPVAGLDPKSKRELFSTIQNMKETLDMTIILVSHSMDDVSALADKILVLDKGSVVMFDETKKVFKEHDKLYELGLDVPETTKLLNNLKDNGFDVDTEIFDIDATVNEICEKVIKVK